MIILAGSMASGRLAQLWSSSWECTFWSICMKRESYLGMTWAFEASKSSPMKVTSLNPFQTVPSTEDQTFKYLSLWVPFSFKSLHAYNVFFIKSVPILSPSILPISTSPLFFPHFVYPFSKNTCWVPLSASSIWMGVKSSMGTWETPQGPHPCRKVTFLLSAVIICNSLLVRVRIWWASTLILAWIWLNLV